MVVSKNSGNPKWMIYKGKLIRMDDLGGTPIFGSTHISKKHGLNISVNLGWVLHAYI